MSHALTLSENLTQHLMMQLASQLVQHEISDINYH